MTDARAQGALQVRMREGRSSFHADEAPEEGSEVRPVYRWAIVFVTFAWIAGIVPVVYFLHSYPPSPDAFGMRDVIVIYVLLPLFLFVGAAAGAVIVVPLCMLVMWAIDPKKHEPKKIKTLQERYVDGEIDLEELERRID